MNFNKIKFKINIMRPINERKRGLMIRKPVAWPMKRPMIGRIMIPPSCCAS